MDNIGQVVFVLFNMNMQGGHWIDNLEDYMLEEDTSFFRIEDYLDNLLGLLMTIIMFYCRILAGG
jgi:hypothetical protein